MVLDGITVRGSIVGTRKDLQEALDFAGRHKVKANVAVEPLTNINDIFARMHAGKLKGVLWWICRCSDAERTAWRQSIAVRCG